MNKEIVKMYETIADALEILQEDKTVNDVLNTVGAAVSSLSEVNFSIEVAVAISVVLKGAEKRINEITQSKQ